MANYHDGRRSQQHQGRAAQQARQTDDHPVPAARIRNGPAASFQSEVRIIR